MHLHYIPSEFPAFKTLRLSSSSSYFISVHIFAIFYHAANFLENDEKTQTFSSFLSTPKVNLRFLHIIIIIIITGSVEEEAHK